MPVHMWLCQDLAATAKRPSRVVAMSTAIFGVTGGVAKTRVMDSATTDFLDSAIAQVDGTGTIKPRPQIAEEKSKSQAV